MKVRRTKGVDLRKVARELEGLRTRVGFFDTAKYPDGVPVALVATVQEYGYPQGGVPARPFFGPTRDANKAAWDRTISQGMKAASQGTATPLQVFEAVGLQAQGDLKRAIIAVNQPKLTEGTIRARQRKAVGPRKDGESRAEYSKRVGAKKVSDKVLNDSGLMLASVLTQTDKG